MKRDASRLRAQRAGQLTRLILLCSVLVPVAPVVNASPSTGEWVHFPIASPPPSPLRMRKAREQGIELDSEPIATAVGLVRKPTGRGPFPAVIMVNGCAGSDSLQHQWANDLNEWGYMTLQIDSLERHGSHDQCRAHFGDLSFEAFAALEYLRAQPFVASERIGIMGTVGGGMTALSTADQDGPQQLFEHKFGAVVALYPWCRSQSGRHVTPVLVLAAGRDELYPAEYCKRLAAEAHSADMPFVTKVYPAAYRGFDRPELGEPRCYDQVMNALKNPPECTIFGYNREAHEDARAETRAFFAQHLQR